MELVSQGFVWQQFSENILFYFGLNIQVDLAIRGGYVPEKLGPTFKVCFCGISLLIRYFTLFFVR